MRYARHCRYSHLGPTPVFKILQLRTNDSVCMLNQEIQLIVASISDVDTFVALERKVSGSKIYSPILDRNEMLREFEKNKMFLIKMGGVTVETIMYELKAANHAYISGLVIDPDSQRQGIGRKSMLLLLEMLVGLSRIDMVTHPDNNAALSLYESLGFSVESRQENYFGDGEPRLVLVRQQERF